MSYAIRAWFFSPFHKLMAAFALPAIFFGAAAGDSPWQLFAGMLGVAVYLTWLAQADRSPKGGDNAVASIEDESPVLRKQDVPE